MYPYRGVTEVWSRRSRGHTSTYGIGMAGVVQGRGVPPRVHPLHTHAGTPSALLTGPSVQEHGHPATGGVTGLAISYLKTNMLVDVASIFRLVSDSSKDRSRHATKGNPLV